MPIPKDIINQQMESLDDLLIGGMSLIQPLNGYRFSIDAVLLAYFPQLKGVKNAIDLGTGHAIIPHLLSYRDPAVKILGIEIQENMFLRAKRSIEYNHLEHRISLLKGDIKEIKEFMPPECAQLVTCNPPFWKKNSGAISRNVEQAAARHEILVDTEQIIAAARHILVPGGKLCIIHICERLQEILQLYHMHQIAVKRIRFIHSRVDEAAKLFLLEGEKGGHQPLAILPPLIIYERPNKYSQEILRIYNMI